MKRVTYSIETKYKVIDMLNVRNKLGKISL